MPGMSISARAESPPAEACRIISIRHIMEPTLARENYQCT
jgi:hypothetical protein